MQPNLRLEGASSGNLVEVAGSNQVKVIPEIDATNNDANIGGTRLFYENDQGLANYGGMVPYLRAVRSSDEYRKRVELDVLLDEEVFSTVTQNLTKHSMTSATYVPAWTLSGFNTNPTYLTTAGGVALLKTYKTFSIVGTETLSLDAEVSLTFSNSITMPGGTAIELGFGLNNAASPYEWFDGIYVRFTAGGVYLIMRNNSNTDTNASEVFVNPDGIGKTIWQPVAGRKYQFIIYVTVRMVRCWISDPVTGLTWLANSLLPPQGYAMLTASSSYQMVLRQYQSSSPLTGTNLTLGRYSVRRGGGQRYVSPLGRVVNRAGENINSPGTLTTTANQTITTGSITRPAAIALTNTTAALTSLSGIILETPSLASGTDGILLEYLNPALPTAVSTSFLPTRRLRIDGIRINAFVSTVFTAGGPMVKNFYIAIGSTSGSLAGVAADTVTTKAFRRIQIDYEEAWITAQAVNTFPTVRGSNYARFKNPLYVNPGEYVALICYCTGTPVTAGTIQRAVSFDFTWE